MTTPRRTYTCTNTYRYVVKSSSVPVAVGAILFYECLDSTANQSPKWMEAAVDTRVESVLYSTIASDAGGGATREASYSRVWGSPVNPNRYIYITCMQAWVRPSYNSRSMSAVKPLIRSLCIAILISQCSCSCIHPLYNVGWPGHLQLHQCHSPGC